MKNLIYFQNFFFIPLKDNFWKTFEPFSIYFKKKFIDIVSPLNLTHRSEFQHTEFTTNDLSRFFEKENWSKSFLIYPYFSISTENTKDEVQLLFCPNGKQVYLSLKDKFFEWRIIREIIPIHNGKSAFREIIEIRSNNIFSKLILSVFEKYYKVKIQELIKIRSKKIFTLIRDINYFPQKINFYPISFEYIDEIEYSTQKLLILPVLIDLNILKNFIPKYFTPKFFENEILIYVLNFDIVSIKCKMKNSKEYTEYFQKLLPNKSEIYIECFPYSNSKIVGENSSPVFAGSIFKQKALLEKEIEWNFSPIEIREINLKISFYKNTVQLLVENNLIEYKINQKADMEFPEFGLTNNSYAKPATFINSSNSFNGYYLPSGILKRKVSY